MLVWWCRRRRRRRGLLGKAVVRRSRSMHVWVEGHGSMHGDRLLKHIFFHGNGTERSDDDAHHHTQKGSCVKSAS